MIIKDLEIIGVGGIDSLKLSFDPQMNLICGPNGIGKTTIIECIAHAFFLGETNILKKNVRSELSKINAVIEADGEDVKVDIDINVYEPNQSCRINGLHKLCERLLSLKTTRIFSYQPLNAVGKDTDKAQHIIWGETSGGVNLHDVKNWFVNRYLYSKHEGALDDAQIHNFEIAKKCFSLLNSDFTFSKVNASSNEIIISSPTGDIYYEYLSSGFKSCISILFGIMKEIEFRYSDPKIKVDDFEGIVIIDELELHLHPDWQSKISKVLVDVFPKIQFIATTHSPHVIQCAEPRQIIALESHDGKTELRKLPESIYGFKGWSIEEVLIDVMGMHDTRTDIFLLKIDAFGKAIEAEEYDNAYAIYADLDQLLHPHNTIRKLLKFQLASIKEAEID
ncbi:MAG: AAA family ATPase [Chlorobium sp.]|nr:MAG: recombinase RecF [Chlorobium sp.]